ncbi:MAG: hypothetical protein FJX80_09095 [Bacteroidetes bacterium]|nr:hypothetical protein [Bacteroidota bacterium]
MSQDKIYVIGIGGTGMRCLECFVHLCAIGMFDNKEINILTLDTDQENGNLTRVWQLIDLYNRIKSPSEKTEDYGGKPLNNTFFSAKLNLTKYWPDYSGEKNYKALARISNVNDENTKENIDLASLFLSDDAQSFYLREGYRAQTHLGSQLMYHAIMEATMKVKQDSADVKPWEKDLMKFIEDIGDKPDRRVFIFGSIFGGTGASSIPVVPKAFNDALYLKTGKNMSAKFGASLLTEYFKFKSPNDAQKKKPGQNVVADSNYFTLNSQAALQFYRNDPTVQDTYKCLYNIGWPVEPIDFSKNSTEAETITGGKEQKNPCHITELVCAFAAYDFINRENFENKSAEYLFRDVPFSEGTFHFDFEDMTAESSSLKNAFAGFYSIALMTLTFQKAALENTEGISGWLQLAKQFGYDGYSELDSQSKLNITNYLKTFLFSLDKSGHVVNGWLYQIRDSFNGKFLLPDLAYAKQWSAIEKINAGTLLPDTENQWGKDKSADKCAQQFAKEFGNQKDSVKEGQGKETKERIIAQLFNTISTLQKLKQV